MKKEVYICDVCQKEHSKTDYINRHKEVIFTTEQDEGYTCKPYFEFIKLDLCEDCIGKALKGNAIYAQGAQGHNKYYFKK